MIKLIKFRTKNIPYNTETQEGFDEILAIYDKKIMTMVSSWDRSIPEHDMDDLAQICRMKLVEALDTYNDKANIHFSTYVYTIWKRKLSQLRYKYKTKKNSGSVIRNDYYISHNYAFDKLSRAFYLMVSKHKCPLSRKRINQYTCLKCEFHEKYTTKKVLTGKNKNKVKHFTKCKYLINVLDRRGVSMSSLDRTVENDKRSGESSRNTRLSDLIPSTRDEFKTKDFHLDLDELESKIDRTSFIILKLIVEGYTKREIINKLEIDDNEFNKLTRRLNKNRRLKKIVNKG